MKKAVIYTRTARKNDAGVEAQILDCVKFARENGFDVHKSYNDNGKSGKNTKRRAFQKMVADGTSGKAAFQHVIVYSLDRFSRDSMEYTFYKSLLREYGVSIVSVTDDPMTLHLYDVICSWKEKEIELSEEEKAAELAYEYNRFRHSQRIKAGREFMRRKRSADEWKKQ